MEDLEISPASLDETELLVDGARTTYAAGLRTQRGLTEEAATAKAVADIAALLPEGARSAGQVFLAARRGRKLLGGVWAAVQGPDQAGGAWVYHLQVDPRARRQGVATALMRAAADAVRERGATHLGLNVFGDNAAAIGLYERLGYTVTAQQMALPLDPR